MEQAILRDQEKHPACYYSRQTSSTFQSASSGGTRCEELQKAYRNCPNEPPVQIYSNTETKIDNSNHNNQDNRDNLRLDSMLGDMGSLFAGLGSFGSFDPFPKSRTQDQPMFDDLRPTQPPPHKAKKRSFREYNGVSEDV